MVSENPYESSETKTHGDSARPGVATARVAYAAGSSFLLGFALWACSRSITGADEPWDSTIPFYSMTMLLGGTIVGFIAPKQFVAALVCVWLGQVLAIATVPWLADAGWLLIGTITTAIGSLFLLPGLLCGWFLRSVVPIGYHVT